MRAPLNRVITGINVFYPKIKECKGKHNYPNFLKVTSSENNLEKFYIKLFQINMPQKTKAEILLRPLPLFKQEIIVFQHQRRRL